MALEQQRVTVREATTIWGKGWIWVLRDGRESPVLHPSAKVAQKAGERAFKKPVDPSGKGKGA
jgi:hypothetical protein